MPATVEMRRIDALGTTRFTAIRATQKEFQNGASGRTVHGRLKGPDQPSAHQLGAERGAVGGQAGEQDLVRRVQ